MPVLVAPARAPDPTGKPVPPPQGVFLFRKVPFHLAATAPPARYPLIGRPIAPAGRSLIYSRIWSNSQSHAGPCPSGDGLLPLNRGRESVTAIPTFRVRAEE